MKKHDIDWTKSHNGVMLCTFDKTYELMPEVKPILEELKPLLELDEDQYLVDVKIHMLMPGQFPCIPDFHFDFMPRDAQGKRTPGKADPRKMYMWLSGAPLREYKDKDGLHQKPAQQWHEFSQKSYHRGTECNEYTWRCFIRVIPKDFVHTVTLNVGEIRRHTQVYLDSKNFYW